MESVILVGKALDKSNGYVYSTLSSHFLHKMHSNALPFREVLLGGNGKLWKKNFSMIKVHYHGNGMVHFMKTTLQSVLITTIGTNLQMIKNDLSSISGQ